MALAESTSRAAYRLPAKLGAMRVVLLDYSRDGVVLEHYRPLKEGENPVFLLEWDGERVTEPCRVAHSEKYPVSWGSSVQVFRSSLRFIPAEEGTIAMMDRIIRERSRISVALQMANASGQTVDAEHQPTLRDGLVVERSDDENPEFLRMSWSGFSWSSACTHDSAQPANGFTIDADEPSNQVQSLCELYEVATAEGRQLIREQARLSLEGKIVHYRARSGHLRTREYKGRPPC